MIYLFQSGGPSQLDLFDHKPLLVEKTGEQLPDSVRGGQRLTGMSGNQSSIPLVGLAVHVRPARRERRLAQRAPAPHGAGRRPALLHPHDAHREHQPRPRRDVHAERQPDPGPAEHRRLARLRPRQRARRPALVRRADHEEQGRPAAHEPPLGRGLPADEASGRAVPLRRAIPCSTSTTRRACRPRTAGRLLDGLRQLHEHQFAGTPDAEITARIANYEMAFRMQASVPEVTDFSDEPQHVLDLYGPDAKDPGTFAANCLLARRLAERGVRFIQLYHQDWDHHGGLKGGIAARGQADRPAGRRARAGSREPRHARRHARGLGGRVRPHDLLPGALHARRRIRPRPPSALLHDLDGRRRREARHRPTARPTTSATTS